MKWRSIRIQFLDSLVGPEYGFCFPTAALIF